MTSAHEDERLQSPRTVCIPGVKALLLQVPSFSEHRAMLPDDLRRFTIECVILSYFERESFDALSLDMRRARMESDIRTTLVCYSRVIRGTGGFNMSETVGSLMDRVHRQATRAPVTEIAGLLQEVLSRRLTAYIASVGEGRTVSRWASGEIALIRDPDAEQRIRVAYEIAQLLLTTDSPQTVKAWFIGLNPQLGDVSPVQALHDGQLKEALAAARAFTVGG